MWTTLQNAKVAHIPPPPTRTYPQGPRLRPDALRLSNIHLKFKSLVLKPMHVTLRGVRQGQVPLQNRITLRSIADVQF